MTVQDALRETEARFRAAGLGEPRADARILVETATGLGLANLIGDPRAPLGSKAHALLDAMVARRLAHEPVFRILGRREFWGLDLAIGPAVLDPRPDTETVVAAALDALRPRRTDPLRLLDLGTGSGAILCALLRELPRAIGIGVDRSADACAVARRNILACGFEARASVQEGDWATGLGGVFDLVVANPPYIETAVIAGLSPEVRDHDPHLALDGGPDGLDAYRSICPALTRLLGPGGVVVFEVGTGQAGAVADLLRHAGLRMRGVRTDTGGHERAVVAGL